MPLIGRGADLAVARAAGDAGEAVDRAHRALAAFGALAMPFDVAEAPRAHPGAHGVGPRRRRRGGAAVLVRELGGGTTGRGRVGGELAAREREALELIALGMSNARSRARCSSARRPPAATAAAS